MKRQNRYEDKGRYGPDMTCIFSPNMNTIINTSLFKHL